MERIFRFPIKVGKESIDVLGHTNNKEYLRWMEEAALAHSDSLGWTMGRYLKIGKVFVASTHKIEYLRPTFEAHVGRDDGRVKKPPLFLSKAGQ